jgi:hypothetical protein
MPASDSGGGGESGGRKPGPAGPGSGEMPQGEAGQKRWAGEAGAWAGDGGQMGAT